MMTLRTVRWLLVATLCSTVLVRAETAAPTSGFRAEFLGYLEGTEKNSSTWPEPFRSLSG